MANLNPNDLNVYLNNFSLSFLQGYHQTGDKHSNLFYSPISLASTLLLLLAGADGSTQQELVDLLGLNDLMKNQKLEVAFKKLNEAFKLHDSADGYWPIQMTNRMYYKAGTTLLDGFRSIAKETHDADLLEVDFSRSSSELVKKINEWIETETKNKIQNALDAIEADTVMLLINVVYFKAKWTKPLTDVRPEQFTNLNGEKKSVEMMCQVNDYPYGQFERYQIVQLDYHGNSSMYVVLPNRDVSLDDLLRDLNAGKLNDDLHKLKSTELDLQMPKFTLKSDLNLRAVLEQLGVKTMFSKHADLSRMSKQTGLRVSRVLQSAYIAVDEEGTEAAAATICTVVTESLVMGPQEFHVNRPFLFIIRLKNVNIFAGAIKQF